VYTFPLFFALSFFACVFSYILDASFLWIVVLLFWGPWLDAAMLPYLAFMCCFLALVLVAFWLTSYLFYLCSFFYGFSPVILSSCEFIHSFAKFMSAFSDYPAVYTDCSSPPPHISAGCAIVTKGHGLAYRLHSFLPNLMPHEGLHYVFVVSCAISPPIHTYH
jgi:hypothetical protein